ncbi:YchJ family protein [Pelistega sp. NLN82]|uniref:UPF0225 protein F9B74_00325 n=1 Tax=Pelistega ratti TaxID=2652177 RepID=A0A6L9Y3K1_9BURK|nr:YchJ family protein [Pelistega ratti]NEN74776.1 YchJ family protein [Pelistega ratti]
MSKQCPCGSYQPYTVCCEPFHLWQQFPKAAEQLMRSRYSAYVLHQIDYIIQTTLPIQQKQLDYEAIRQWSIQTDWQGLKVIQTKYLQGTHQAKVTFEAYYQEEGELKVHHEVSTFIKIAQRWYFKDPTVC